MYPTKMEANGHIYPINTDYRIAIACFKALNDEKITDLERFYAVETLLLGENVLFEDEFIIKKKIELYLRCGRETNVSNDQIDFDYIQDEEKVRTSIRQVYNNLDIGKIDYLHWYEYNELIEGLTNECLINKVREVRNLNENDYENQKDKDKVIEAKKQVALKTKVNYLTEEEKESIKEFYILNGLEQ